MADFFNRRSDTSSASSRRDDDDDDDDRDGNGNQTPAPTPTPTPTHTPTPAPSPLPGGGNPTDPMQQLIDVFMQQVSGNAGKPPAVGSPSGAIVQPPAINLGFDPFTYGFGPEATFVHRTSQGQLAPLASVLGIGTGVPPPATPATPGSGSGTGPTTFFGFRSRTQNGRLQIHTGGNWQNVPDQAAPFGGFRTRTVNGVTQIRAGGNWQTVRQNTP